MDFDKKVMALLIITLMYGVALQRASQKNQTSNNEVVLVVEDYNDNDGSDGGEARWRKRPRKSGNTR